MSPANVHARARARTHTHTHTHITHTCMHVSKCVCVRAVVRACVCTHTQAYLRDIALDVKHDAQTGGIFTPTKVSLVGGRGGSDDHVAPPAVCSCLHREILVYLELLVEGVDALFERDGVPGRWRRRTQAESCACQRNRRRQHSRRRSWAGRQGGPKLSAYPPRPAWQRSGRRRSGRVPAAATMSTSEAAIATFTAEGCGHIRRAERRACRDDGTAQGARSGRDTRPAAHTHTRERAPCARPRTSTPGTAWGHAYSVFCAAEQAVKTRARARTSRRRCQAANGGLEPHRRRQKPGHDRAGGAPHFPCNKKFVKELGTHGPRTHCPTTSRARSGRAFPSPRPSRRPKPSRDEMGKREKVCACTHACMHASFAPRPALQHPPFCAVFSRPAPPDRALSTPADAGQEAQGPRRRAAAVAGARAVAGRQPWRGRAHARRRGERR